MKKTQALMDAGNDELPRAAPPAAQEQRPTTDAKIQAPAPPPLAVHADADAPGGTKPAVVAATQACDVAAAAVAAAATAAGQTIWHDMRELSVLARQREALGAGDILLRPLPLRSPPANEKKDNSPTLVPELLQYEDDGVAVLSRAVDDPASAGSNCTSEQVVAFITPQGTGKITLDCAQGMAGTLVLHIQVQDRQHKKVRSPWWTFIHHARVCEACAPSLAPDDARAAMQSARSALQLLVLCYAKYVAQVLEVFVEQGGADRSEICEAALRCLRCSGDSGPRAVGKMYTAALAAFSVEKMEAGQQLRLVDAAAVDSFAAQVNKQLRGLLPEKTPVMVWCDQVDPLLASNSIFGPFEELEIATPTADMLAALVPVLARLKRRFGWEPVLCGESPQLRRRLSVAPVSIMGARIRFVDHASVVDVSSIVSSMRHYFRLPEELPQKTLELLQPLFGRATRAFEYLWPSLWQHLRRAWGSGQRLTTSGLLAALDAAAQEAEVRAYAAATELVERLWPCSTTGERCTPRATKQLIIKLYAALKLNAGEVLLQPNTGSAAIYHELLALPSSDVCQRVRIGDEPLLAAAIEAWGDARVNIPRHEGGIHSADVFCLNPVWLPLGLEASANHRIHHFEWTTSVEGQPYAPAFAWHVIRSLLVAQGAGREWATMGEIVQPLIGGQVLPSRVANYRVAVRRVINGEQARKRSSSGLLELEYLADHLTDDELVMNLHWRAGAHMAFTAYDPELPEGGNRVLVLVAIPRPCDTLADCIAAVSPAWQYISSSEREAFACGTGALLKESDMSETRPRWTALATSDAHTDWALSAVRIVFSPIDDFAAESYAMCNQLTETSADFARSPVVLCRSTVEVFGEQLYEAMCCGEDTMAHTDDMLAWLPPKIDEVDKVLKRVTCRATIV